MVTTKDELKAYIEADKSRYSLRWFDRFIYSEPYHTLKYLKNLRKLEFLTNCKQHRLLRLPLRAYRYWLWRKQSWKYGIKIAPNTCGKGLYITHIMGGVFALPIMQG